MNIHENARLTPAERRAVVAAGTPAAVVAAGHHVSDRTVWKWVARARDDASPLTDRSSRPHRLAQPLPRHQHRQLMKAWTKRWSSVRIAMHFGLAVTTSSRGSARRASITCRRSSPPRVVQRYEWHCPATCCASTSRKSGRSDASAIRSTEIAGPTCGVSARSTSTSRSTRARAWLAPISSGTRRARPPPPFSSEPWPATPSWVSGSGQCSVTTVAPTAQVASPPSWRPGASSFVSPCRPRRAPTARPNASSRLCSASGRTPRPIRPRTAGRSGSIGTSTRTIVHVPLPV